MIIVREAFSNLSTARNLRLTGWIQPVNLKLRALDRLEKASRNITLPQVGYFYRNSD